MIGNPTKGSAGIAQSFMNNKATQPAAQLPTITQPQQRPMPTMPVRTPDAGASNQSPVLGSMAPPQFRHGIGGMFDKAIWEKIHDKPGMEGFAQLLTNQPVARFDVMGRQVSGPVNNGGYGGMAPRPQVQPRQISDAQLMAREINRRAQERG